MDNKILDCVIIGAGPAGVSASVYAKRYNLDFVIIEKDSLPGGKASIPHMVENYIGFPDGIQGYAISERFEKHLKNLNVTVKNYCCEEIIKNDNYFEIVCSSRESLLTKTIIVATGTKDKELGIPGEIKFKGKGVSYCATCDAPFYKGKSVAVIGGGDTALSESIYLSEFASEVFLIHRRENFRGAELLQERVKNNNKIKLILNSIPVEIEGNEFVNGLKIKNTLSNDISLLPVQGVFIFAGSIPNTSFIQKLVNLDSNGYIITDEFMETSENGIFAAGDVRAKLLRQIVTAISDGAIAVYSIRNYLKG
jgi:thioredoxin reductase (NADPH)